MTRHALLAPLKEPAGTEWKSCIAVLIYCEKLTNQSQDVQNTQITVMFLFVFGKGGSDIVFVFSSLV